MYHIAKVSIQWYIVIRYRALLTTIIIFFRVSSWRSWSFVRSHILLGIALLTDGKESLIIDQYHEYVNEIITFESYIHKHFSLINIDDTTCLLKHLCIFDSIKGISKHSFIFVVALFIVEVKMPIFKACK